MPVDTKHPEYLKRAPDWQQMRRFVEGQRAVHAAGELDLPRLYKEPDDLYNARVARAGLFNATGRTVEGLVGMLFRSDPEVEVSPAAAGMLADVTKSGESLVQFAARCAQERLTVGKVAVLTDYPPAPTERLTVAQVEAKNIRPNLARYTAESLINWEYGWVNNKTVLVMAVLEESTKVGGDKYAPKYESRFRVLELDDAGFYTVSVWRKGAAGDEIVDQPFRPQRNGQPLAEIPLRITGDGRPPLLDLCNVNRSHYQTTADLEHGAHQTALPQAWIAGDLTERDAQGNPTKPELYIGGGFAWTLPPGATAGYLEFTGRGLGSLENRLKAKEQYMAVLGARMLEAQKSGVEAADTAGMHRAGEQSILQHEAGGLSADITRALVDFDIWAGGPGKVRFEINKDFLPTKLTAQELTALMALWQGGGMSFDELFGNLQRGGWLSEGADAETERTKIDNAGPVLTGGAAPGAAGAEE